MDEIKDGQKTDSISRFIDGHSVKTNPFGENRAGDRAYRRAERIAAAIHLLTNHISPAEPVSNSIRAGAVALLNSVLELRSDMRSSQSQQFAEVQARIRNLISLVRILTVSGHVSMQNASTMVEALDELGNYMSAAQRSVLSENIVVSREDLLDVRMPALPRTIPRSVKDIKDNMSLNETKTLSVTTSMSNTIATNNGHVSVRAQSIIDILKNGGQMGIRDICSNLPEYSEKMIQRELLEMVSAGMVAKTGLKRWSRYSVATKT